ncbi:MAG: cellulose binding domain-containing protein, partial [Verrucomicrobiota bacterium]|nr:cellulose binding domain-containing protein [Verrucomicrobiota bacterium]
LAPGKSTTFSFVAKRPELPGNVITTPAFSSVPAGVVVTTQITSQWGGEFLNLQVNVTNNGPAAAEWEVTFDLSHHVVQSYWSAAIAATASNSVTFKGQSWNKELNTGQSTSFGLALKQIP